ncbi:MAG: hypothetical protein JSU61_05485 [Fidelibacterota bacterium]|nr:MAG: hypothetical protein JSU61_05485 [Candidatus Neomarinimicrobiota bacterium]
MSMPHPTRRLFLWLGLFGLAFGYIEAAVVVYLREPYYPGGFHFPLATIPSRLVWTEVGREAATLLLLLSLSLLAARSRLRRFAVFAFCFGVWDLVYYLALKLLIGWPASLLDWDVLFLIPLPWTSPVLAPMLVSLALIAAAAIILRWPEDRPASVRPGDWLVEVLAGLVIIASFLWNVPALQTNEAPDYYPWWLFSLGLLIGIGWFVWRLLHQRQETPAANR